MSKSGRKQRIINALHKKPVQKIPPYTMGMLKRGGKEAGLPPISADLKPLVKQMLDCANRRYMQGRKHARQGYRNWDREDFMPGEWSDKEKEVNDRFYSCYMAGYKSYFEGGEGAK